MKKTIFLIGTLCVSSLLFSSCDQLSALKTKTKKDEPASTAATQTKAVMAENTLARVGDWMITTDEFNQRLQFLKQNVPDIDIQSAETKALLLEDLIRQRLLVVAAKKEGLDKDKDIQKAVEDFKDQVLAQNMIAKIVGDLQPSEEDAKKFYEQNKEQIITPETWRVRELVVEDEAKANELLVKILQGADFAQTAKENSVSDSAENGGDLGFLADVPFPEMANALIPLKVGGVSSVFSGPDGKQYIVKLEEKKTGEQIPYEQVKDQILQNLAIQSQQQALLSYLEKLKATADIEVKEQLLK